mgnify:CR=1 FL=1
MRILITTDENFSQHAAVCIASIIANNPHRHLDIRIASLGLTDATKSRLRECVNRDQVDLTIIDFDVKKLDEYPEIRAYKKNIYLRLWVDDFFPENDVDKVLYLDADTINVNPLSPLFSIDLGSHLFGAVTIPGATSQWRCGLPPSAEYFNSGVLLFNLPEWRKENPRQTIINFLNHYSSIAFNPDQDALNGCFSMRRFRLAYRFNAITPFFRKESFASLPASEISATRENVAIVHFNGRAKPWMRGCAHPYTKRYLEYRNHTPWKNAKLNGTWLDDIKRQIRRWIGLETFIELNNLNGIS